MPASAGVHQVWDEAHFFKSKTLEQLDDLIQDIHARFGKDVMVETFAYIPDDFKPNLDRDGKEKFYQSWTASEAMQLEVNGILILITGVPAHLQVEVSADTRQKLFTYDDRSEMAKALAASFHQKDFDGGIVDAVQFVRERMGRNAAGGAASQPATKPASAVPSTQPSAQPSK